MNPDGDKVTVKVEDDIFEDYISFKKPVDPLIVPGYYTAGTNWVYWHIDYYNEDGDKPNIKVYTKSHPTKVTISPISDLGDNGYVAADPESKGHNFFGRTTYPLTLATEKTGDQNEVLTDGEGDIIYLEMTGETFSIPYTDRPEEAMRKE